MYLARAITASFLLAHAVAAGGQECVDIEGEWEVSEQVSLRCCVGGACETLSEEGSGVAFFEQDGCHVTYVVPGTGLERTGEITGDMIRLTGRLADPLPDVTITENRLDVRGTVTSTSMELTGTGRLRGRIEGRNFECTVNTNGTGRRDAPVPTGTTTATPTFTQPAPPTATATATVSATPSPTATPTCGARFGLETPVDPPNIVDGHLCGRTDERDEVGFKDRWEDADENVFNLSCEPDLRFHLTFARAGGSEVLVGICPWIEGQNFATVLAGSDRREGERYDCFQRSFWFSREPELEQGLADTVDWVEYRYDVRTGKRTLEHWVSADGEGAQCPDCKVCEGQDLDPLEFPPVTDCAVPTGTLAGFCFRGACTPVGVETRGAGEPPSGFMTGLDVQNRCDVDLDGACDADDLELVRAALGQCEGDAAFLHTADADFDDCITDTDIGLFFPRACFGDCDGSGAVSISELLRAVNVALSATPASTCSSGDVNADGMIAVNELVRAVGAALNGCDF